MTTNPTPTQPETLECVDRLLRRLIETPAGERIRMKCGAADLRSVITDILFSLGTITKPFPDPRHWQPVEEDCEACERGYRLAPDGLHYDDDRGGQTWGMCRKVVVAIDTRRAAVTAPRGDVATTARNRDVAQRVVMSTEGVLGERFDVATRHELADRITATLDAATSSPTAAESDEANQTRN